MPSWKETLPPAWSAWYVMGTAHWPVVAEVIILVEIQGWVGCHTCWSFTALLSACSFITLLLARAHPSGLAQRGFLSCQVLFQEKDVKAGWVGSGTPSPTTLPSPTPTPAQGSSGSCRFFLFCFFNLERETNGERVGKTGSSSQNKEKAHCEVEGTAIICPGWYWPWILFANGLKKSF